MAKTTAKPASLSAFGDKAGPPTAGELQRTLGPAGAAWSKLAKYVEKTYGPAVEQWNFAGAKFGWSLRLRKAERVILYLIPQAGQFLVGIVLGGKAVDAAQSAGLPAAVLAAIAAAPRYAEGTGLRLPIAGEQDLPPVEILTALKMARL
jgi:hypothetical protein